ncbi:MAG: hypothetical protein MZV64_15735 [Ignavibacteriales bacterium]|nr:hypothetical protein [Ignavibacteriales bacterium]
MRASTSTTASIPPPSISPRVTSRTAWRRSRALWNRSTCASAITTTGLISTAPTLTGHPTSTAVAARTCSWSAPLRMAFTRICCAWWTISTVCCTSTARPAMTLSWSTTRVTTMRIVGHLGDRVIGLDMAATGAIIFDTPDDITIQLGAQADTFYVPATTAGLTTKLRMGGGFDKVYVGTVEGAEQGRHADNIQGEFIIDGEGPESQDELFLNDQSNEVGQTFTVSNELKHPAAIDDGTRPGKLDTTTVERSGMHSITYRRMETVALNAGTADDLINLEGTHREQSAIGGLSSTFTVNAGLGDDTVHLGAPVAGGYSLAGFQVLESCVPVTRLTWRNT